MSKRVGFLVREDYQPNSVGWESSGERWGIRTFPTKPLVYHLPTELVAPVSDRMVQKLGLNEGDLVGVDNLGRIVRVHGQELSYLQRCGLGRPVSAIEWETAPNKRERLLDFTGDPTASILSAIYPIPVGSVALLVGGAGSRKTTWLHLLLEGLVPSSDMDIMLLLVDERTHEVRAPAGVELWAATTRQSANDIRRFADLAYSVAKSRAASGRDVVLFLDSLYRLAVLENVLGETKVGATSGGAKTDVLLEFRRKRLAVAGCAPGGGSLTIIGTNLVEEGNALSKVLAETMRGSVDVHIYLRPDGSAIDWTASFCRGLEHLPAVDAKAVWSLQRLMRQRVSAHMSRLLANEREARRRRKDESPIDDAVVAKLHERAIALAGDDFNLLVTELGGEAPHIIWKEAEQVLVSSMKQRQLLEEDAKRPISPAPVVSPQQLTMRGLANPNGGEVLAMAQNFAGKPAPAKQPNAGTSPEDPWEKALRLVAQERNSR